MPTENIRRQLSRMEAPDLIAAATKIAGFDLGKRPTFATAANVSGLRTRALTFSRRRDCLTIFATDLRYGHTGKAGAWTGPDRRATAGCRRVLRAASITSAEVSAIDVLSEYGTVAERGSDHEIRVEERQLLRKLARASRAIEGVPIWSSHVMVGLTANGEVGQLELHWPQLAPEVVKEAHILAALVERGFEAPKLPGARIESMAAGIIHSPPIGFFVDMTAAIRAVYLGEDPTVARKPVLYLDRHGELVARPRDIEAPPPEQRERDTPRTARAA
jgi:hypothetical protein